MKKLFIGLLIIAAGTGGFFLLRKKNNITTTTNKDWIIGKWQIQPPNPVIDTTFTLYQYDFQKEGVLLQSLKDSIATDTMHYEWNKRSQLVWKKVKADSTERIFEVAKLGKDSMEVRGADSIKVLFTRLVK
jgi:hypothetical protein